MVRARPRRGAGGDHRRLRPARRCVGGGALLPARARRRSRRRAARGAGAADPDDDRGRNADARAAPRDAGGDRSAAAGAAAAQRLGATGGRAARRCGACPGGDRAGGTRQAAGQGHRQGRGRAGADPAARGRQAGERRGGAAGAPRRGAAGVRRHRLGPPFLRARRRGGRRRRRVRAGQELRPAVPATRRHARRRRRSRESRRLVPPRGARRQQRGGGAAGAAPGEIPAVEARRRCRQLRSDGDIMRLPRASLRRLLRCSCRIAAAAVVTGGALAAARAETLVERTNRGLVEMITDGDSAAIDMARDLASVLDDGATRRVLPAVGYGGVQDLIDLKALRGIDIGIIQSDALDYAKKRKALPGIENVMTYIAKLHNEELHVLARAEVKSLDDLAGKKVDFTGGAVVTGRNVFNLLRVEIEPVFEDRARALEKLKAGEIAALAYVAAKPTALFERLRDGDGLHFLA